MEDKRITVFAGDSGSGKTTLALNYAMYLRGRGLDVALTDLDVINTYFKAGMCRKALDTAGIELIRPDALYDNLDSPALTAEMFRPIIERDKHLVIDLGGTEKGAAALGRFAPEIAKTEDFNMVFVVNFFRPLTTSPEEAYDILRSLEQASSLRFTCIVDNSNYGKTTSAAELERTAELVKQLCRLTGLPLLFTAAKEDIFDSFCQIADKPFKLKIFDKQF